MTTAKPSSLVLYAIDCLRREGSWCGETHVQKSLYLGQELFALDDNFKYVLYKHGPYSFELSACLQAMIADGLLLVQSRQPYGPTLVTNGNANRAMDSFRKTEQASKVEAVTHWVGTRGVSELERVATAVYINGKNDVGTAVDQKIDILVGLKPHVSLDAAREAFASVDELSKGRNRSPHSMRVEGIAL